MEEVSCLQLQWTQVYANDTNADPKTTPAARCGHAMTLLSPSKSVLVFGGSDGKVFYDDFYVLEPDAYIHCPTSKPPQNGNSSLSLTWKKLVVSYAPPSSHDSQENATMALPHHGSGRDYHTMHYVPDDDEHRHGFRVLVIGNVMVSSSSSSSTDEFHDPNQHDSMDLLGSHQVFEIDSLRVEEVRIKQPVLEAQWSVTASSRSLRGTWKPRARQAHCSALLHQQYLYCFGGKDASSTTYFNDIFYLDVKAMEWRLLQTTGAHPPPRAFAKMTTDGHDRLFLYGGYDGTQQFGGLYVFETRWNRWDKVVFTGDKPSARINHGFEYLAPHHLVLFGGKRRTTRKGDSFVLDLKTKAWKEHHQPPSEEDASTKETKETKMAGPCARTALAAVCYSRDQIVVFGGYAGSHRWLNDLHLLSVSSQTTSKRKNDPPSLAHTQPCRPPYRPGGDWHQATGTLTHEPSTFCPAPTQHRPVAMAAGPSRPGSGSAPVDTAVLNDITNLPTTTNATQPPITTASMVRPRQDRLPPPVHPPLLPSTKKRSREERNASSQDDCHSRPSSSSSFAYSESQDVVLQLQKLEATIRTLQSAVDKNHSSEQDQMLLKQERDQLLHQVELLTQKVATTEEKFQAAEREKQQLRDQLALQRLGASHTSLPSSCQCKDMVPTITNQLLAAIHHASQQQFTSTSLLESRVASIHNLVEELRHKDGDRTETDDTPEKRIMPSATPPDLQTPPSTKGMKDTIQQLTSKLEAAEASNVALQTQLTRMEEKLQRAQKHFEIIRESSLGWME